MIILWLQLRNVLIQTFIHSDSIIQSCLNRNVYDTIMPTMFMTRLCQQTIFILATQLCHSVNELNMDKSSNVGGSDWPNIWSIRLSVISCCGWWEVETCRRGVRSWLSQIQEDHSSLCRGWGNSSWEDHDSSLQSDLSYPWRFWAWCGQRHA